VRTGWRALRTRRRRIRVGVLASALAIGPTALAAEPSAAVAQRPLDESCKTILTKSSHEWSETCANQLGDSTVAIETALARYGECYEAATEELAKTVRETVAKPGTAATTAARGAPGCLPALQQALAGFTEYALGAALTGGTYSRVATAFATLYEKQFPRLAWEAARDVRARSAGDGAGSQASAATSDEKRLAAARARLTELFDAATPRLRADLSERFEALLTATKRCDVPPAPVYEFAILILQSPADPPFSPPPF
jgi:hypothetical protein